MNNKNLKDITLIVNNEKDLYNPFSFHYPEPIFAKAFQRAFIYHNPGTGICFSGQGSRYLYYRSASPERKKGHAECDGEKQRHNI